CALWNPRPRDYGQVTVNPIIPASIDYVDADGFDGLLESALVNQDPAIVIRTGRTKPDWGDRLNAWIAAWNMAGQTGGTVRMQAPLVPQVVGDEGSIREFRLLVEGLMSRLSGPGRLGLA